MNITDCRIGQRVRIKQEIERREGNWRTVVEGVIEELRQQKTGSWYAHAKDDKLWLYRVRLRKLDGEVTTLNVDALTEVELVAP